ncbi:SLATT domain-containing protein [uncultured Hyphomonas sp.]|uniref:SLATT domain-containing protein n=1 Tax=uncultured Hyphomonas sp. TaxID=225298 RepID=UPI002AAB7B6B|nr:SLATT domain-containing protein [uncultured Hyphomonas sp.]
MDQNSQAESGSDARSILEGQIRECFGRVVYSHKTHEKCADILLARLSTIKLTQIILSSITTASFFVVILGNSKAGAIIGVVISTVLLVLHAYTKNYDLGELAQKHRQAAADIWLIREEYISLLTDLRAARLSLEKLGTRRDELLERLHAIYTGAPSTTVAAYRSAQKALQTQEDMTFSDQEIDAFLPNSLHQKT